MANTIRDTEVQKAQNNPNIISSLVGAPNKSSQMTAPMVSPNVVPQDIQDKISGMSNKLYGSGFVPQMEAQNEAAYQEMFNLDQALEKQYSPYPDMSKSWLGYVENPADLASAYAGAAQTYGNVGQTAIQAGGAAERAYTAALQATMDKFIDFLTLQESRKDKEEDRKYQEKKDRYDVEMAIAKLVGGNVTNPFTGEAVQVPAGSGGEGTVGERAQQNALNQLRQDIQAGVPYYELGPRYQNEIPIYQIRAEYNKGPLAQQYGQAAETAETETGWGYKPEEAVTLDEDAVNAYVSNINDGNITVANVPKEYKAEVIKRTGGQVEGKEKQSFFQRLKSIL